jgi:hypothetical protein
MKVRLSQGKFLSKADEEFQAFIDKKNSPPEQPKNVLIKKPSPQKPTRAEAQEDRRKLATGEAQFAEFLARHNTKGTLKQSTNPVAVQYPPVSKETVEVVTPAPLTPKGSSIQAVRSDVQEIGNVEVIDLRPAQDQDASDARKLNEAVIVEMRKNDGSKFPDNTKLVEDGTVASRNMTSHMAIGTSHTNQNRDIVHTITQTNANINKVITQEKTQPASFVSSPPFWSVSSFSDVGEKPGNAIVKTSAKEGVRATQTQDAKIGLVDWDGKTWMPPPIWEERGVFDTGFISAYISEWAAAVARPTNVVDVSSEGFWSGESVINNYVLAEAPSHDPTLPGKLQRLPLITPLPTAPANQTTRHRKFIEPKEAGRPNSRNRVYPISQEN